MESTERHLGGRGRALSAAGACAVVAGLAGLGAIGYWYGADMGWTGSGSTIRGSRTPILAAALVPTSAVLMGVIILLVRGDLPARSRRATALTVAGLLAAVFVWFAVDAYPQVEPARLLAIGDDGGPRWRVDLPVTEVHGLRSETDDAIILEGRADRRSCDWQARSVTIDRATGMILAVRPLPDHYRDQADIPPPPEPIKPDRGGFEVQQGSAPFVCRS